MSLHDEVYMTQQVLQAHSNGDYYPGMLEYLQREELKSFQKWKDHISELEKNVLFCLYASNKAQKIQHLMQLKPFLLTFLYFIILINVYIIYLD